MTTLSRSYDYCTNLTQRTAHNFRFSFLTLPPKERQAMNALYAFNRITDDLGDSDGLSLELRKQQLANWRASLKSSLSQPVQYDDTPGITRTAWQLNHPAIPAIVDTIEQYQIPVEHFFAVIDGVEMDLRPVEMENFAQLQRYCYHVAGAVGLCCIHIWGFDGDKAIPAAVECGMAFQLTNILRDLAEDAAMGRVYLPKEDLQQFGYRREQIHAREINAAFQELMKFEVQRTKEYYARAHDLFDCLKPSGRRILRAMIDIYYGLLLEIERRNYDVYSERVSLSKWKKLWFAGRAILSGNVRRSAI